VTRAISGHLDTGVADFVYLPVEVPRGVQKISVSYSYDKPVVPSGTPGNSCDIGIFDERGIALGGRGFRGWSGGSRTSFEISNSEATPGYLPGPVGHGTWHIVLGPYQVAPQGLNYQVQITLTYGPAGPAAPRHYPPQRAKGRGRAWYRGDCHLHTVHSDGKRQPSEVATGARAAGLDFMVSTDHNTSSAHAVWGDYADSDLLIITGEEVTTRNGHWLALGLPPGDWVDWRYRTRDDAFPRFARKVRRGGGLVVPAHMYCAYVASQWKFGFDAADATEVWTGPWTYDDEHAISTWDQKIGEAVRSGGRWIPAMGNSDAHSEPQVIGLPHNVVLAEDLSTDAVMDGIRAGHSWIAESSAVQLTFTASGNARQAGIGETLTVPPETPVDIRLDIKGRPQRHRPLHHGRGPDAPGVRERRGRRHGGVAYDGLPGRLRPRRSTSPDGERVAGTGQHDGRRPDVRPHGRPHQSHLPHAGPSLTDQGTTAHRVHGQNTSGIPDVARALRAVPLAEPAGGRSLQAETLPGPSPTRCGVPSHAFSLTAAVPTLAG
jgi:hypothetical protein